MRAFLIAALALTAPAAHAEPTKWGSVYTSVAPADCIEISKTPENGEGDFYEAECTSYGGYRLRISGGDLRYQPVLSYGGQEIQFALAETFHDMGAPKVEWLYSASRAEDGTGILEWRALIFRQSVADPDGGQKDRSLLYVVRLNGPQTCLIGSAATNEAARDLAQDPQTPCR